jgi:hypothetical protein
MTVQWKIAHLELARTPDYPDGSPGRTYTLRLPLDEAGLIDEEAVARHPELATVRRAWPDEPDRRGYIVRKPNGWAFSYAIGDEDDEGVYHLEAHPMRAGDYITLTEPDGERLPFRVISVNPDREVA